MDLDDATVASVARSVDIPLLSRAAEVGIIRITY